MDIFRIIYSKHDDSWYATASLRSNSENENYMLTDMDNKFLKELIRNKARGEDGCFIVEEITFNRILNEQGIVRRVRPETGYKFDGQPVIS